MCQTEDDCRQVARRRILIIGGLVLLAFGSLAYAQRIFVGGGGRSRFRPNFATLEDFDGSFIYCRGFYRSVRGEAGGQGWSTWEREGENKEYFSLFSPRGYAIGVNVVVYALTH